MKKRKLILAAFGTLLLVGSCARNYRCQCDTNGHQSTIHTSKQADAEAQCDELEYLNEVGGSGDCYIL